jgi:hypothetical protein
VCVAEQRDGAANGLSHTVNEYKVLKVQLGALLEKKVTREVVGVDGGGWRR